MWAEARRMLGYQPTIQKAIVMIGSIAMIYDQYRVSSNIEKLQKDVQQIREMLEGKPSRS